MEPQPPAHYDLLQPITAAAFLRPGQAFLTTASGEVHQIHDQSREVIRALHQPTHCLALGGYEAQARLALGHPDGHISLLNTTGDLLGNWEAHKEAITALSMSPDGHMLASGATDGQLKFWHTTKQQAIYSFEAHPEGLTCCSLSDNGALVLTGGGDGLLHLWIAREGRLVQTFRGHQAPITACHLKGELVLSGDALGEVRVWDILLQDPSPSLAKHSSEVLACRIFQTSDQTIIGLSAARDGQAYFLNLRTGDKLHTESDSAGALVAADWAGDTLLMATESGRLEWRKPALVQG
jgi:WD40 repeat protein